jgi:outer membrane protein OmpA-like peptidoglycan-associated protein
MYMAAFATLILVGGCAALGNGDKTWKGAAIGTAGGAAAGAAIGATQGDAAQGALWGATAGVVVGTATGMVLDHQEEQLRRAGIRTERDAQGRLLVSLAGNALTFEFGQARLQPQGKVQLNKVAGILKTYPENRIMIGGHTDSVGSVRNNLALSQARAESVKAHLLHEGVMPNSIVSTVGYGEEYPVADNATAAGRAMNRRVEFRITVDAEEARVNQQQRERY